MPVDVNSPEYKRGKLGEAIVIDILRGWGADVTRPNGTPAEEDSTDLFDFKCVPGDNPRFSSRYVEVKVRAGAMQYAYGQYPCYTFPVVQIEAYEKFCAENRLRGELWIVDLDENAIFIARLGFEPDPDCWEGLENKKWIDGKEFPFDQNTSRGKMRFFHRDQFTMIRELEG